jgi:hypothetical protein
LKKHYGRTSCRSIREQSKTSGTNEKHISLQACQPAGYQARRQPVAMSYELSAIPPASLPAKSPASLFYIHKKRPKPEYFFLAKLIYFV